MPAVSAPPDALQRLKSHFTDRAADEQTSSWDELWQQSFTPWDREKPNPGLTETMQNHSELFGSSVLAGGKRKRALVPGCGRGYDVLFFASLGYDAYGIDGSQTAVDAFATLKKEQGEDSARYPVGDASVGRGDAQCLVADFFTSDVETKTGGGQFDVIYDYTFLCALPPSLRPKWAKRMGELLAPEGHLVCLEFPLKKDPKSGGPPHALSPQLYQQLFARPGEEVEYKEDGHAAEETGKPSEYSLERLSRAQAEKEHDVGRGADYVSVWQHRRS